MEALDRPARLLSVADARAAGSDASGEALPGSEDHFRMLSEHASDLVRIVQGDGTILYASPSHQRILGYAPQEMLGRSSFDFVHPDDLARMLAEFNTAVERGEAVITSTYRVRRADGAWRTIEVNATNHLDDPVLRGMIVNGRDITERVAVEEALRASEERFRALTERATDMVRIMGADGNVAYASPSHQRFLGYAPQEMLGRPTSDFVHPDDYDRVRAAFMGAVADPDVIAMARFRMRHANGSWRVVEAQGRNHLADPAVRGFIVNSRDITERVAAEEALRASEERFRTLVEKAPLGVGITDEHGLFESVNAAYLAIYGYTREEMLGQHFTMLLPQSLRAESGRRYERLIAGGSDSQREYDVVTRQGEIRTVLVTLVPMSGPDGRARVASFVIDISERKRTEKHLDHLAHHDTLTGLPNRVLFHDRLTRALVHARRHAQLAALLFLDLDGFKAINDTHGHAGGDVVLQAVAQRLRGCVREEDTVARLGGDEFTVLLPNVGSGDNAASVARKILGELSTPYKLAGHDLHVTVSIGVSLYPFDGQDAGALMRAADMAMYRAKGMGKNTFALYESRG